MVQEAVFIVWSLFIVPVGDHVIPLEYGPFQSVEACRETAKIFENKSRMKVRVFLCVPVQKVDDKK